MNSQADLRRRLIVALDVATADEAVALVRQLTPEITFFKIGLQLYTAAGPDMVRAVSGTGARVFLDLKLHDIPNTVARAVQSAVQLDVEMLTLHLSGGSAMLRAAVAAAGASLLLLGVTVLTSSNAETLRETGVAADVETQVVRLAQLGAAAGIGGLVASPHEVRALRADLPPDVKIITPGVRPTWAEAGDQQRFMTPAEAFAAGADYLVIGRPITAARDPREAVARILSELA